MIPGARLIILGRQGAGKGTQCVRLSRHYVVPHISTGDMLRAAVRERTELGLMAKEVMDAGGLVGDDIMIGIVDERLRRPDAETRGYILDGFPRTVAQAEALDKITVDRPIHVVIDLDVPRETVLARHLGPPGVPRLRHQLHGHRASSASRGSARSAAATCMQRDDDTPDAVNRRLDLYETQTAPLIEFYGGQGRLVVVDGVGHPDEVFRRLTTAIDDASRDALTTLATAQRSAHARRTGAWCWTAGAGSIDPRSVRRPSSRSSVPGRHRSSAGRPGPITR